MKILVTGGCGFIGSCFIRYIQAQDSTIEIDNVDKLTYAGDFDNLRGIDRTRYNLHICDISVESAMDAVFDKCMPEVVVNFAAETHVDRSITGSSEFMQTNVMGTMVLLDMCRKYGIDLFCQVSSDEVYGSLGPDDSAFTEATPIAPNSPYSASKASADMLVRSYVHTHDFPAIITRCSNNYGPYQHPEKFVPLFITNAIEGELCPLYGDGLNVRDWIHVKDHCSGIWSAIQDGCVGQVYNFGGLSERRNIEIARNIMGLLGKSESLIEKVADRPGHDKRYAMNIEKVQSELGWSPSYSFEAGLRETVEWYKQNKRWWGRRRKQRNVLSQEDSKTS